MSERAEKARAHGQPRPRTRPAEEEGTGARVGLGRPRLLPLSAAERAEAVRLLAALIRAALRSPAPHRTPGAPEAPARSVADPLPAAPSLNGKARTRIRAGERP